MVVALQDQQSNQRMSNDECSSGGTNPTPISNLANEVITMIQVSVWVEEAVATHTGDAHSATYKTLIRRVSQNVRTKDDFK